MRAFLSSSLGKKYIMAISGLGLTGFVIVHLLGNLQIFLGAEAVNAYAKALQDMGPLLWAFRAGLIVFFVIHVATSIRLSIENKRARPVEYAAEDTIKATLTSRTMMLSGMLILSYIIYHLMHFTFHTTHPEFKLLVDAQGRKDVYRMMIMGFTNVYVSAVYIFAMFLLGSHLHHAASSVFQSLGLNNSKYRPITRWIGPILAVSVVAGYVSIPLAVFFGWVE